MIESSDTLSLNQCYKCDQRLLDNLNIEFNITNSMVCMWNKYQLFIYKDLNFASATKIIIPEFQVYRVLITNNHLLCLDMNGFVHATTLNTNKIANQPLDQNIKTFVKFGSEEYLSLKCDSDTYFLCLNKVCGPPTAFKPVKKVTLSVADPSQFQYSSTSNKYWLTHHKIDEIDCTVFEKIFSTKKLSSQYHFVVVSFDKHTIYGCLLNPEMAEDKTDLIKLYSFPSEICYIEIVGTESTYILVALRMGVVLRLKLHNLYKSEPDITYLNSALHKVLYNNDTLMYTDGTTMWKANNIFTKKTKFSELFVRNVNDFAIYEDKAICTTFTKLIYSVAFNAKESCLILEPEKYHIATKLVGNAQFLFEIFKAVDTSKKLTKKVALEGCYISAMGLTRRQDIVHQIISSSVKVCGTFEEVMRENAEELTLPEDISQYVEPNVYLIHISSKINSDGPKQWLNMIKDVLSNCEAKLQVTISNKSNVLKTTFINMSKASFLIPLHLDDATEIYVNIRLVVILPGTYDERQLIWTEIYKENVTLTLDHFIREKSPKSLICFKGIMNKDFEEAVLTCSKQSENEFIFSNISSTNSHIMYVRLPLNFSSFDKYFVNNKFKFMPELLSTDEFLKSQRKVSFKVGKETVAIALENDGFSNPRLIVTSGNLQVTAHIRNFFADMIYGECAYEPGQEFINIGLYTKVENLKKDLKKCVIASASNEELAPLVEKFEKEILPMLPV